VCKKYFWLLVVIDELLGLSMGQIEKSNRIVMCPYCGERAKFVQGKRIYHGRGSWDEKWFWACLPCGAWVGCHAASEKYGRVGDEPLGRLANEELRIAKMGAHEAFDPIWKEGGVKRKDAYKWLAEQLGIPARECHIGMFDVDMCRKVIHVVGRHVRNRANLSSRIKQ
jgi:hypothetical protein